MLEEDALVHLIPFGLNFIERRSGFVPGDQSSIGPILMRQGVSCEYHFRATCTLK
jgi:hypothetical protein